VLAPRLIKIIADEFFVSFDIVLFLNRLAFDAERWSRSCINLRWERAQAATQGGCPYLVRRIRAVLASGPCACLLQHVLSESIDGKHDLGTHTRTPTRKDIYNTHPRRIASQRSAAHVM